MELYSDKGAPEAEFIEPELDVLAVEINLAKARREARLARKGVGKVTELETEETGRRVFEVVIPAYNNEDEGDRAGFETALRKEYPHRVLAENLAKGDKVLTRIFGLHLRHTKNTTLQPKIRIVDGKPVKFYETYQHKVVYEEYGVDDEGNIYRYDYNGWVTDGYLNDQEVCGNPELTKLHRYTDAEIQEIMSRPEPDPVTITKISYEELPQL